MAGKIRVHELAKELGLTNKEALDLCVDLGIGVKTHSSSIEEAQADRARRKAHREGMVRDEQPEEPTKAAKKPARASKKAAPAAAEPTADAPPEDAPAAPETPAPAPAVAEVPAEAPAPVAEAPAPAPAPAAPEAPAAEAPAPVAEAPAPPAPAPAPPVEAPAPAAAAEAPAPAPAPPVAPPRPAVQPDPSRVVSSSGRGAPPRPAPAAPEAPAARRAVPPTGPPPGARPAGPSGPPGAAGGPPAGPRPARPAPPPRPSPEVAPKGLSGKPIPPPPGPLRGASGRPIPPPPGLGGRGPSAPSRGGTARPGAPSRPAGGPSRAPGARPGGPMGGPPPGGGPGGGGPGRPGGPAGRRPPRRKGRRRRNREELRPMDMPEYTPADAAVPEGVIVIERGSTPQEIGPKFNRTAADVVRFLMQQGEMVTATQSLTDEMIELFAVDVGAEVRLADPGEEQEVELQKRLGVAELDDEDEHEDAAPRPPVITVMGHVDHGKTKLLDQIRNANVVAGEAGGITQHIGAYQVEKDGRRITFIDTPGHEAFSAMRARGADATDIVILVVAADDGVMPQTIEALDHAKAAEVPIVVAINKIDRDNADPQRVMSELAERGLVPEAWGGDTIMVETSALQNLGIDDLLEQLLVVADVEELTANPDGRAMGVVLESHLDVGRGPVASLLVQRGTLKVGDPLVAGAAWGRVRALIDDNGKQVKEAGPSTPVAVLGLSDVARAGDDFVVAPDDKTARAVADQREHYQRVASISGTAAVATGGMKLEDIFSQIQAGEAATLNVVIKADVNGSLEAVTESLKKLERDDVKLAFARRGVGGITKDDIQLAVATNATIIGFNVRPDRLARELAAQEGVEIRSYEIIYKLIEDIQNAMVGMLAPEYEEVVTGDAEVREIFRVPRIGAIAGCYVTNGVITRGSKVRFLREGTIIWKGAIASLKRFKDDVREVAAGYECGIGLTDFQDLKPGDIIETFEEREIPRT